MRSFNEKSEFARIHVYTVREILEHHETRFPLAEARDKVAYDVRAIDYESPPEAVHDDGKGEEEFWNTLEDYPEESDPTGVLYDPPPIELPALDEPILAEEAPKKGAGTYADVAGRMTRIQKTARVPNMWPEAWQLMSKKQRKTVIMIINILHSNIKANGNELSFLFPLKFNAKRLRINYDIKINYHKHITEKLYLCDILIISSWFIGRELKWWGTEKEKIYHIISLFDKAYYKCCIRTSLTDT